jgi:hypothetical protein
MTDLQPYVHSPQGCVAERTIKKAIDTPIKSYIPEYMTFDHVRRVMAEVVEGDWRAKAAEILRQRIESGEGDVFRL